MMAMNDNLPLMRKPRTRLIIAAFVVAAAIIVAFWIGRRSSQRIVGSLGLESVSRPTTQLERSPAP